LPRVENTGYTFPEQSVAATDLNSYHRRSRSSLWFWVAARPHFLPSAPAHYVVVAGCPAPDTAGLLLWATESLRNPRGRGGRLRMHLGIPRGQGPGGRLGRVAWLVPCWPTL